MKDIAIVMPTYNRNDFVIRCLHYYAACSDPVHLYIGDSTDQEKAKPVHDEMRKLEKKIGKVTYIHCPNMKGYEASRVLLENVEEEFVCWIADDDFQLIKGIKKCIRFLEENPDYFSCGGDLLYFVLKDSKDHIYGKIAEIDFRKGGRSIEQEKAHERVKYFSKEFFTQTFSVYRTKSFLQILRNAEDLSKSSGPEFLREHFIGCFSSLSGKIKKMDEVCFIRQFHPLRWDYYRDGFFIKQILCPNFSESIEIMKNSFSKIIVQSDALSEESARKIVEEALYSYFYIMMKDLFRNREKTKGQKIRFFISSLLGRVPFLRSTKRKIFHILRPNKLSPYIEERRGQLQFNSNHPDLKVLNEILKKGS